MDDYVDQLAAALRGRYTIERELGAGGMATVYLAEDLKHKRNVAMKVLRPELAAALGAERFLREITITANLNHPHILPLLDSGKADSRTVGQSDSVPVEFLYYVMPYVEGESLRDRLNRETQLPIEDALKITEQVAAALDCAHRHHVIHRDIKPENILLHEGEAMVADFGIALAVTAAGGERLTETGLSVGTPAYMSPEQIAGDGAIDARSDIYALGCVLYEMLAGDPPFTASTPQAVLSKHLTDPVPPVTTVRSSVPQPVVSALEKTLGKVPADRFATAAQMAQALRAKDEQKDGKRPEATLEPQELRIAVLPWAVRGHQPELSYLEEGMVDLLSASLDGVGGFSSVDPYALIGFVKQRCAAGIDPRCGRAVAEEFGAARYIIGSAVAVGTERFQLTASLYEANGDRITTEQASGSQDSPGQVIDELTRKLLATQPTGADAMWSSTAAITTSSVAALKAYLEGERAYRVLDLPTAEEAFRRAVAEDPTFALAYYRLANVALWNEQDSVAREMTARAVRFRDRLSDRAAQLVDAFDAWVLGDGEEMQRRCRAYLARYPDDAEGWYWFAEAQLHWNPLHGRSLLESRSAFERVVEYYPDHPGALLHLVQLAAIENRIGELDTFASRFAETQNPEYSLGVRVLRAFALGDQLDKDKVMGELTRADDLMAPFGPVLLRYTGDFGSTRRLLRLIAQAPRSNFMLAFVHIWLAHLDMLQGNWAESLVKMRDAERLDLAYAIEHAGFLTTASFVPARQSQLEDMLLRLKGWSGDAPPRPINIFWASAHDGLHQTLRFYLLGRVAALLGDHDATRRYADQLQGQEVPVWAGSIAEDLALGLRALVLHAEGRAEEALQALENMRMVASYPVMEGSPFHTRAHEHWLHAELLAQLGRYEEAIPWYATLEEKSIQELIYLAPSHLKRGEMHEHLGNTEQALEHYAEFVKLWQDCDPELRPMVEDARERIARLAGEPRGQ